MFQKKRYICLGKIYMSKVILEFSRTARSGGLRGFRKHSFFQEHWNNPTFPCHNKHLSVPPYWNIQEHLEHSAQSITYERPTILVCIKLDL